MSDILVETKELCEYFQVKKGFLSNEKQTLKAVDRVSVTISKGETLGLVGESGCGKTTFGKTILYLNRPTSGQVLYDGTDIGTLSKEDLRKLRLRMQIVYQDPYGSLNTRMSVGDILQEPMVYHRLCTKKESHEKVRELLEQVGLRTFHESRYPHEFSGGQRQRIAIARALAVDPEFIVCDEPVSALDVSVQSQVLNLLSELKEKRGLTYLFISHDLSVVRHISDRIGVMYLGQMVETAPEEELFRNRLHPYTKALFDAMPVPKSGVRLKRTTLQGDLPSPINPPSGCHFRTRCPYCTEKCSQVQPVLKDVGNGHFVACHLFDK